MSRYWTYTEIKDKIQRDLGLEGERFVSGPELLGYVNEAIDEAEAEIHTLYEDYFVSRYTMPLVSGTEEYALPPNIYAHKIRKVYYRNGSDVYDVARLRDGKKFSLYALDQSASPSDSRALSYFLVNDTAGSPKMLFTPTPAETGPYITVWYIRNANRLVNDSDICDIPEFINFVIQYVKVRCYEKDMSPLLQKAVADLEGQRNLMNATLSAMVPDAENQIEADMTFYSDMN